MSINVVQPTVALVADHDNPYLNQGPVRIRATLDPIDAYPQYIQWSGPCAPDPNDNRQCWAPTTTFGPKTIAASYAGAGGAQVTITVQTRVVEVAALGFTGDLQLSRWPNAADLIDPNGQTPTWLKSSPSSSDPVAYPYQTAPTAFVQVSVTPALSSPMTVSMRARNGATVIATKSAVQLSGTGGTVTNITFGAPLESGAVMRDYTWQWEVSFDEGQSWQSMGSTGPQRIHWTFAAPVVPVFVGLSHSPSSPDEYHGLFDKVLLYAGGALGGTPRTDAAVITQQLTAAVATSIAYDPYRDVSGHPFGSLNWLWTAATVATTHYSWPAFCAA